MKRRVLRKPIQYGLLVIGFFALMVASGDYNVETYIPRGMFIQLSATATFVGCTYALWRWGK